jgi:threonine/homoserine/homoserine lactone efflux protein
MIELLTVFSITMLAVISPGPDFAMVSRNSMIVSRKAGLLTAIGISVGVLVHVQHYSLALNMGRMENGFILNTQYGGA